VKILAIDTAGWESSVALWEDGKELIFRENKERNQAATLPRLVKEVLGAERVDLFLVNIGPGSFTGIRVGLAFAKGLTFGLDIPLKGIDAFTATYLSIGSPENVLVLIEAHRQDVFGRWFQKGAPQPPASLTREEIEVHLNLASPPFLAGNGIHPFLEGLSFQEVTSSWKGAQCLAYAYFINPTLAIDPSPFYVREADVSFPTKCI
jgi:tRNA threonylcarbamoyladenosine biosynthesis protein TsaB